MLNLDAGERRDETEGLWTSFDLLNCACGGHAGDTRSMDRVAMFCARTAVKLGAHPSYPDPGGFGRRSPLEATPAPDATRLREIADLVAHSVGEQCRALADIARRRGVAVVAVKPHGALYHDAASRPEIAVAVLDGAVDALGRGITVIGPPSGALYDEAARRRLLYAREGFADRRVQADGSLVPRTDSDALIVDPGEAADQARRLAPALDTICIHGDTPGALAIARAVREALRA